MRHNSNFPKLSFFGLLACLVVAGNPALGAISLPTAVEFEKSIYFQKPDGEPVPLNAGIYEVEQGGEAILTFEPVSGGDSIPVQALPAGHQETIQEPKALLTPSPDNNPDKQHVVLWMPDGSALEAVGSFSGIFSRSSLTWSAEGEPTGASSDDVLTINFEMDIYFKTVGGDPKLLKAGPYSIALGDGGLVLTPPGSNWEEAINIEQESLSTSAAVLLPEFEDNPNLKLLMLSTADGRSFVALGSHDGTFPRGLLGAAKGAAKKVGGAAKGAAQKGYGVAKGKVGQHGKKAISTGANYAKKHGRTLANKAYQAGKGVAKKACGNRVSECLKVAGAMAASGS